MFGVVPAKVSTDTTYNVSVYNIYVCAYMGIRMRTCMRVY